MERLADLQVEPAEATEAGRSSDDDDLAATDELDAFREYRASGDRALRNALIERYRWIAVQCARRFEGRGEPSDDLAQVAMLGVLKAVERFDPEFGVPFGAFAMPTVLGELRRHFRDATWAMRVPRRAKELHVEMGSAIDELTRQLQRAPTLDEIAGWMNVSVDLVHDALEAAMAYRTRTLTTRLNDGVEEIDEGPALAVDDPALDSVADRVAVHRLMAELPVRDRTIVFLRFYGGLTQAEIADRVGMSQVHVSRLLRAGLARIGRKLDDVPDPEPPRSVVAPEPA